LARRAEFRSVVYLIRSQSRMGFRRIRSICVDSDDALGLPPALGPGTLSRDSVLCRTDDRHHTLRLGNRWNLRRHSGGLHRAEAHLTLRDFGVLVNDGLHGSGLELGFVYYPAFHCGTRHRFGMGNWYFDDGGDVAGQTSWQGRGIDAVRAGDWIL